MKKVWPSLLLLPLLLSSCLFAKFKDTCTQGDNMSDPRISGNFDAAAVQPELHIVWDLGTGRGADLPPEYFSEVQVATYETEEQVVSLIREVTHSAERELIVRFSDLNPYLAEHDVLSFSLAFPDRMGFIDCRHPGMLDRYLLRATLTFDESTLTDASIEQVFIGGAF